MKVMQQIKQLCFDFSAGLQHGKPFRRISQLADEGERSRAAERTSRATAKTDNETDEHLEAECRRLLLALGMSAMASKVRVRWNTRLRSSAGFASYPAWTIELNPRLREFAGQVERTMRHELAHLVAYQRAGHTRIEAHGSEWQRACHDLGIGGETAHHHLPLPRNQVRRNFTYVCVSCGVVVRRVKRFRRKSACRDCCARHSGGQYDERFRFEQITEKNAARFQAHLQAAGEG